MGICASWFVHPSLLFRIRWPGLFAFRRQAVVRIDEREENLLHIRTDGWFWGIPVLPDEVRSEFTGTRPMCLDPLQEDL